jgi:hypothetical protein
MMNTHDADYVIIVFNFVEMIKSAEFDSQTCWFQLTIT